MSNYTHTPGPWKRSEKADGNWWHIVAGNQAIATVHAASKKRNEPYASMFEENANLIAAAPELLAALEGLLSDSCVVMNCGNGVLHAARIAIAKAKGGAA